MQPSSRSAEIIASFFANNSDETLIHHVKIFEEDESGLKARFLILSASIKSVGRYFLHKAKRNSNGSFSKGKTWGLESLRTLEVIDPLHFSLTMSKTYRYAAEGETEQAAFIETMVKTIERYMGGRPPKLIGIGRRASEGGHPPPPSSNPPPMRQTSDSRSSSYSRSTGTPTPLRDEPTRQPSGLAKVMISPSTIISTPHQPSLLRPPQLIIPKRADPSTLPTAPKEKPAAPSRLKTQPSFSRALLLADDPLTPLSAVRGKDDEGEEDVILANVEELLDGWEWDEADAERAEGGKGGMEKRLGAELLALEAASIHSLMEADEGVNQVLEAMDRVILQLDQTDERILSYKIQLNAVAEDVSYIEFQSKLILERLYAPALPSPPALPPAPTPAPQPIYRPSDEYRRPSQESNLTDNTPYPPVVKQDDWIPPAIPTMGAMGQPREWADKARYDGVGVGSSLSAGGEKRVELGRKNTKVMGLLKRNPEKEREKEVKREKKEEKTRLKAQKKI